MCIARSQMRNMQFAGEFAGGNELEDDGEE